MSDLTLRSPAGRKPPQQRPMTEKALQEHVRSAARQLGWLAYHSWISIRSEPGYPDVTLVRDGRCIVAELKRDGAEPTTEQRRWLEAFALVPGVEVHVWRPADWESGEVVRLLAGEMAS